MDSLQIGMNEPRTRVNFSTLPSLNGRPVILVGTVEQIDGTGQNVKVKTSDGQIVVVKLEKPLQEILKGVVEFHGTSHGRYMNAEFFIKYPGEPEAFDMDTYNQALTITHAIGDNPWTHDEFGK